MDTSTQLPTVYTCRKAADKLGVSDARIRQICIEHAGIGSKHGAAWLLTPADLRLIRKLPGFGKKTQDQS